MKNIKNTFKNTFAIIGIAATVILACSKAVDEVVAATTEPPIEVIVNDNVVVTDNSTSSSQESNLGKYQLSSAGPNALDVVLLNTTYGKFVFTGTTPGGNTLNPREIAITKYAAMLD